MITDKIEKNLNGNGKCWKYQRSAFKRTILSKLCPCGSQKWFENCCGKASIALKSGEE